MHASVGPTESDRFFKCANGDVCRMVLRGNGFASKDRVMMIPLHEKCGHAPHINGVDQRRAKPWSRRDLRAHSYF